ncbi:hypothetical protein FB451DRAFT_1188591 [Mycena latifolia]|nr:hypothetical protein FB451DRAFT_1188591 [Mycena latifolia]
MSTPLKWAKEIHHRAWIKRDPCTDITNGVTHLIQVVSGPTSLIIVREEYPKIWAYIEEASCKLINHSPSPGISRGLVVWGHPGIRKSLFLVYALVQSLLARKPVALCHSPHSFLYFDESGTRLVNWPDGDALDLPSGVIALYDMVAGQDSPKGRFTDIFCGAYVVHATSPKVLRWKEWAKQLDADLWPMPLWSNEELQQIDALYPRDTDKYYTALQLAAFLGPSPRKCAVLVKIGSSFDDYTPLDFTDGSALYNALANGEAPELSQGLNFHLFFFAGTIRGCGVRKHTSNPAHFCRYYIPTRFLRQAALETFRKMSIAEQQNICHKFSAHPQLCGAFYEVLGLKVLVVDGLLCKFPRRRDEAAGNSEDTHFQPAGLQILESDDDQIVHSSQFNVDRLWIPPPNFPSVDAVVILNGGTLVRMLQLTIAHWHVIKSEGITRVILKFSAVTGVRFEFVFITPSEEIGRRMALTRGTLSQRQPYALRIETAKRQAPIETIKIPVGYAVAGFMKPEDLRALATDRIKLNLTNEPADQELFDGDIEMDSGE